MDARCAAAPPPSLLAAPRRAEPCPPRRPASRDAALGELPRPAWLLLPLPPRPRPDPPPPGAPAPRAPAALSLPRPPRAASGFYDHTWGAERRGARRTAAAQVRVGSDSCAVPALLQEYGAECYAPFSAAAEDREAYGPSDGLGQRVWRWWSAAELREGSYVGRSWVTYPGSGFNVTLPTDRASALERLAFLQDNRWVDLRTRAVFLDMLIYNANTRLVTLVKARPPRPPARPPRAVPARRRACGALTARGPCAGGRGVPSGLGLHPLPRPPHRAPLSASPLAQLPSGPRRRARHLGPGARPPARPPPPCHGAAARAAPTIRRRERTRPSSARVSSANGARSASTSSRKSAPCASTAGGLPRPPTPAPPRASKPAAPAPSRASPRAAATGGRPGTTSIGSTTWYAARRRPAPRPAPRRLFARRAHRAGRHPPAPNIGQAQLDATRCACDGSGATLHARPSLRRSTSACSPTTSSTRLPPPRPSASSRAASDAAPAWVACVAAARGAERRGADRWGSRRSPTSSSTTRSRCGRSCSGGT